MPTTAVTEPVSEHLPIRIRLRRWALAPLCRRTGHRMDLRLQACLVRVSLWETEERVRPFRVCRRCGHARAGVREGGAW